MHALLGNVELHGVDVVLDARDLDLQYALLLHDVVHLLVEPDVRVLSVKLPNLIKIIM